MKPTLLEKIYKELTEDTITDRRNEDKINISVNFDKNAFVVGDTVFIRMTIDRKHLIIKFKIVNIDSNYLYFEDGKKTMYVNEKGKTNNNIITSDAWDNAFKAHTGNGEEKNVNLYKAHCSVSYENKDGKLCVVLNEQDRQRKYYYTHTNGDEPSEPVIVGTSENGKPLNWISTNKMQESMWVLRNTPKGLVPIKITKDAAEKAKENGTEIFVPEEYFNVQIDSQRKTKRFVGWKPDYEKEIQALFSEYARKHNSNQPNETTEKHWILKNGETVPTLSSETDGVEIPEDTMLLKGNTEFRAFIYTKDAVSKLLELCPWLATTKAKWYVKSKNGIFNAVPSTK